MTAISGYFRNPINTLLIFITIGLVMAHQQPMHNPLLVFSINGLGIVPLAQLISSSVEAIRDHLGDQRSGCLNATFDNLVGGLVTDLLLVLGVAAVVGGLRYRRMDISANTSVVNSKLLLSLALLIF